MKQFFLFLAFALVTFLMTDVTSAAAPTPTTKFTLVSGLPSTMNVGDTYTVVVEVTSDTPFNIVQAMPDFYYPGRGVVAVQGGDRAGSGTNATLEVTFTAKSNTSQMMNGVAPVNVVVAARYQGGYVATSQYAFNVAVP